MKRQKGSITVFSLLSLLLITATFLALWEGTRLQEMRRFANLQTETAIESVFARYNTCLWEYYHLLGTDRNHLEQQIMQIANGRMEKGQNFLRLEAEDLKVEEYELFTDAKGSVFIKNVAVYMSDNWLYEAAKEIYNQYEAIKYLMESKQMDVGDIGEALQQVENAQKETELSRQKKMEVKELLKMAKSWQEQGILQLLLEDTDLLSKANQDFSNSLLERQLEKGTLVETREVSWQERLLFQQYLMTYMSHYQGELEGRALSYEIEYLLGKKSSDIENLKVVATEIIAIREAANFVYLLSNPVKIAQAESAAVFLSGATLSPAVVELVKIGLLTAWAFAESILDVRALLAGKRIPLLKSDDTWTTELESLYKITEGYPMAKESSWGLNYENYLSVLLLMQQEEDTAMRAMNLQEATIRKVSNNALFQIDSLITNIELEITYSYKPVVPFLSVIDAEERWNYQILGKKKYGYY